MKRVCNDGFLIALMVVLTGAFFYTLCVTEFQVPVEPIDYDVVSFIYGGDTTDASLLLRLDPVTEVRVSCDLIVEGSNEATNLRRRKPDEKRGKSRR